MALIEAFLTDLDRGWKPKGDGKIGLRVIGSAALMLQGDYERRTKDGDVLETRELTGPIQKELLAIAGKGSELHRRHRLYLDIVKEALPFLPQKPRFKAVPELKGLKNFDVTVLDAVDVAVSKLKRFSANDAGDIRAMVERGLIAPGELAARLRLAVDAFSTDARAEDLPRIIDNFHAVERDFLGTPESPIDLPDWMGE